MQKKFDVIIIGGGITGLLNAIELKKNGFNNILLLEASNQFGGILNKLELPFEDHSYLEQLKDQFIKYKIEYLKNTLVLDILEEKKIVYRNIYEEKIITSKIILMATGSFEKTAGKINLPGQRPQGVHTALKSLEYFNKYNKKIGSEIIILGANEISLQFARTMIENGINIKAIISNEEINKDIFYYFKSQNILQYYGYKIIDIKNRNKLEKIIIEDSNQNKVIIDGNALVISVGFMPNVNLVINNIKIDKNKVTNKIILNNTYETSYRGLYMVGDCYEPESSFKQSIKNSKLCSKAIIKDLNNNLI